MGKLRDEVRPSDPTSPTFGTHGRHRGGHNFLSMSTVVHCMSCNVQAWAGMGTRYCHFPHSCPILPLQAMRRINHDRRSTGVGYDGMGTFIHNRRAEQAVRPCNTCSTILCPPSNGRASSDNQDTQDIIYAIHPYIYTHRALFLHSQTIVVKRVTINPRKPHNNYLDFCR
jgi:hypothetical protein